MKTYKVEVNDNGTKIWYLNGKRHREDGPAIEWASGTKFWYLNGKRHREDGPACEYSDGRKLWYPNGEPHCEDGPASEYADGTKLWYLNGKLHREDGPACEYADGTKLWYLNGKKLTEAEFNARNKPKPTCEGKVVEVDGVKYSRAMAVKEARIMTKQENVLCDTVEVLKCSVKRVPFRTVAKKEK